jgi:hypothetical protein
MTSAGSAGLQGRRRGGFGIYRRERMH